MIHKRPLHKSEIDLLHRTPLFAGLDIKLLENLTKHAGVRDYEEDSLIFSAGDDADSFYAVITGTVRLFILTQDGSESIVHMFSDGESFAEAAMFGDGIFPLNAEVTAGTSLIRIEARPFLDALRADPQIAFSILALLSRHEAFMMAEISQLRRLSPSQRLASYLLSLTDKNRLEDHPRLQLPLAKSLIASRIGIEPESLSRAFNRLSAYGVSCHGDVAEIASVHALREFVSEKD